MPRFLRTLSITVALLPFSITGQSQGQVAPRAQPVYPGAYPPPALPGSTYPSAGFSQERMAVVDPDKKLAAGDQVTVEILEDREGGLPRVVTATGELDIPPLGRVRVSGKSAAEAASAIKTMLERDYYYRATVRLAIDRVSPVAVRSGQVYLSGEIRIGGPLELVSGETLTFTNAILRAGGPTEWGNKEKMQLTRLRKDGTLEKMTVNYDKVIKSGDARQDPVLEDGDRIFVPKAWIRLSQ